MRRPFTVILLGVATAACASSAASVTPTAAPTTTASTSTSPTTSVAATTTAASPTTSTPTTTTAPTTAAPTTTTSTTTTVVATTTTTVPATTVATSSDDRGSIRDIRPPSDIPAPPLPPGWNTNVIGTSVLGREIVAWERAVAGATKGVMVIGGIHGNEPASPPSVRAMVEATVADDVSVWLVPEMNPDGVAAGTRWNANEVDLNRNFPWTWRASTGGPAPLSEPESAAVAAFVQQQRPTLVVWVHQPLDYVSSVADTDRLFEQSWSRGSGLPTRSGVTQHGGGESWTFFEAGLPSVLVEIDSWDATPRIVAEQVAGFQALLDDLGWS